MLKNKRICVTGGAGFLGHYVVKKLQEHGVTEIFIPTISTYNLIDGRAINQMLNYYRPDIIIHLAAQVGGIGANRAYPADFFYNNAMMGIQLIHQAWEKGIEKFVAIGTVCAYPKFTPVPFKEEDLWNGYPEETNAPYGLAKKMLLVQSQAYRQQYGFNSIYLIPANLYGPGDNFDPLTSHVIPSLIRKIVDAKKNNLPEIHVWGDGSATREFLYVDDAAEGIILATEKYDSPEPVNLGTGIEISIKSLVTTISEICGYNGYMVFDKNQPNGQPRRSLDISKAYKYFGFQAKTGFIDGLRNTINWYKERN